METKLSGKVKYFRSLLFRIGWQKTLNFFFTRDEPHSARRLVDALEEIPNIGSSGIVEGNVHIDPARASQRGMEAFNVVRRYDEYASLDEETPSIAFSRVARLMLLGPICLDPSRTKPAASMSSRRRIQRLDSVLSSWLRLISVRSGFGRLIVAHISIMNEFQPLTGATSDPHLVTEIELRIGLPMIHSWIYIYPDANRLSINDLPQRSF